MRTGLYYDDDEDMIVFWHVSSGDGDYNEIHIAISRTRVLQELLELSNDYGEDFTIFLGSLPGEEREATELTFLSPPTKDCILDEEGEE